MPELMHPPAADGHASLDKHPEPPLSNPTDSRGSYPTSAPENGDSTRDETQLDLHPSQEDPPRNQTRSDPLGRSKETPARAESHFSHLTSQTSVASSQLRPPSVLRTRLAPANSSMCFVIAQVPRALNHAGPIPRELEEPSFGYYSSGFCRLLDQAARTDDAELARQALEARADPNQTCGVFQRSALAIAAHKNSASVISELVAFGGKVECGNALNNTPLFYAVIYGSPEAIRTLCRLKADPNRTILTPWWTSFAFPKDTSLIFQAASYFKNVDCVKALLDCGANPDKRTRCGLSTFDKVQRGPALDAGKQDEEQRQIKRLLARWRRDHPRKLDIIPEGSSSPEVEEKANCSVGSPPVCVVSPPPRRVGNL